MSFCNDNEVGGPAFPIPGMDMQGVGMSLRDYFAAKAMQGMVAAEYAEKLIAEEWADHEYTVADAMLEERKKQKEQ